LFEPQEDGVNSKRSGGPHQSDRQPSTSQKTKHREKEEKKEVVRMKLEVVLFLTVYGSFVVQEAETEVPSSVCETLSGSNISSPIQISHFVPTKKGIIRGRRQHHHGW
jgi:hypothetical protein